MVRLASEIRGMEDMMLRAISSHSFSLQSSMTVMSKERSAVQDDKKEDFRIVRTSSRR